MKLNNRTTVLAGSVIALLAALIGLGGEMMRVFSPANEGEGATGDGLNVVHTVEHKSGTGEDDVLTGADSLIVTPEMVKGDDLDYKTNEAGGTVSEFINGEWVATSDEGLVDSYCAPYSARVLNATDSYVTVHLSVHRSEMGNGVGIGPGERNVWTDIGAGEWLLHHPDWNFSYRFDVDDC